MNNHFIIYESANQDSFEQQIMEGAFTVEQLREQIKKSSKEKLKIIKENIAFSGKYRQLIDEGILGFGAPNQRGMFRTAYDKTLAKLPNAVKSQTRNKLIEVYQNVWKEFNKFLKKQAALGNDNAGTFTHVQKFLASVGINAATIANTFKNGEFALVDPNIAQDTKSLAKFIYQVLQAHYQGVGTKPTYRMPQSV